MFHPWDFGIVNARLQEQTMQMTKIIATGSMLKGYTVKPMADIDRQAMRILAASMLVTAKQLQELSMEG